MEKIKPVTLSVLIILPVVAVAYSLMKSPTDSAGEFQAVSPADMYIADDTGSAAANERVALLEQKVNDIGERQNAIMMNLQQLLAMTRAANSGRVEPENTDSRASGQDETNSPVIREKYSQQDIETIKEKENAHFKLQETDFYNEAVDESWRENEEKKISSILSQDTFSQISLNSLECRQSSCRADISHSSEDMANEFLEKFTRSLSDSDGQFKLEKQADGSTKTILLIKPLRK